MYHVTVTISTTTPPVHVVCFGAMLITMMVTLTAISVGQTSLGQHDGVVLSQLIMRDTLRGSVGLITMPQQQQP